MKRHHNNRTASATQDVSTAVLIHCELGRDDQVVHCLPCSCEVVLFDCNGLDENRFARLLREDLLIAASLLTADRIAVITEERPLEELIGAERSKLVVFALDRGSLPAPNFSKWKTALSRRIGKVNRQGRFVRRVEPFGVGFRFTAGATRRKLIASRSNG